MKKKIIIGVIGVLLVVGLFTWKLIKHSYSSIAKGTEDSGSFAATASIAGIKTDGTYAESVIDTYTIESSASEDSMKDVLKILKASEYQHAWRNLLPWDIDSVSSKNNSDGKSILISFYNEDKDEMINLSFLNKKTVAVDCDSNSEYRIYHITNKDIRDELLKYIKKNGKKNVDENDEKEDDNKNTDEEDSEKNIDDEDEKENKQ